MRSPVTSGLLTGLGILLVVTGCGSNDGPVDEGIDPAMSLVTVSRPLLLPGDTVQVTLQARDAGGQPLIVDAAAVAFSSQGGSGGTFLPVVDHQDGTYTANFVGTTPGTALTITAQLDGRAVTSTLPTLRVVGFTRIVAAGA